MTEQERTEVLDLTAAKPLAGKEPTGGTSTCSQKKSHHSSFRFPMLSGWASRIVLGLLVYLPAAQSAAVLTVPPGLNPGDPYRIVFVTSLGMRATSSAISDYNNLVNTVANAPGSLLQPLAASWYAIGSTVTVTAAANIGGASNVPIYLLDGTLVATGTSDLFDGSIANQIMLTETGELPPLRFVWTGSSPTGSQSPTFELGSAGGSTRAGLVLFTSAPWITDDPIESNLRDLSLYGISGELVVASTVPEPSAFLLVLPAFAFLLYVVKSRSAIGAKADVKTHRCV